MEIPVEQNSIGLSGSGEGEKLFVTGDDDEDSVFKSSEMPDGANFTKLILKSSCLDGDGSSISSSIPDNETQHNTEEGDHRDHVKTKKDVNGPKTKTTITSNIVINEELIDSVDETPEPTRNELVIL